MKKKNKLPASKLAESLELEPTESTMFEYIYESYVNGQNRQANNLFNQLEEHAQINFIGWIENEAVWILDADRLEFVAYLLRQKVQEN